MLKRIIIHTEPRIILDREGTIQKVDVRFADKLGYDPSSLVGEKIHSIVPESFRPFTFKALERGGDITVVLRDGNFCSLSLLVDGTNILVFDPSEIREEIRRHYAGVWDFYYGLLFVDKDRKIIAANNTFYRVSELTPEIEGRNLKDVFGELAEKFEDALNSGGELDFTAEWKGRRVRIRIKIREILICGKKIYEVLLRTTEEERIRNLKKTFDRFDYPLVVFSDGDLLYVNPVAERTFRKTEELCKAVEGKSTGKVALDTHSGEREFLFVKFPGDEEICIFIDLHEQNELLRRLEKELKNFRTTFENSLDAILVVDTNGSILLANPAVGHYGYVPEELIGKNVREFIQNDDVFKDGEIHRSAEIQIRDKYGGYRWVQAVASAVKDDRGEVTGAVVILRDISDKKAMEKQIRESEELYRTLAENSQAGIFVIQDDRIVYANRASLEHIGYTLEEITTISPWVVFDETIQERAKRITEQVLQGEPKTVFTRYYTKSGEKRYANLSLVPITYKGKPAVLGNFVDVTDIVVAERKLREQTELYRTLTESSHTGIFIIQNNRVVYVNKKLREMLGYTLDEINEMEHPYMVVHPDFRELAISRYLARERGEDVPESYEVKVVTKSGEERWMKVLARRITFRGKPAVMVNMADVTDIKESEEMFKRMTVLLKVASDLSRAISQEKTEFRILSTLRSHLEEIGIKVAAYIYEGDFIPVTVSEGVDEEFCRTALQDHFGVRDVVRIPADGGEVLILPFADSKKVFGAAVLVVDRILTDEEVHVFSSLARDVTFSFKSMKIEREKEAALRVIMDNLDQFEYLADKLRNPLAIIKGLIEVRGEIKEGDLIAKISEQADRIERILDELRAREIATFEMKKFLDRG